MQISDAKVDAMKKTVMSSKQEAMEGSLARKVMDAREEEKRPMKEKANMSRVKVAVLRVVKACPPSPVTLDMARVTATPKAKMGMPCTKVRIDEWPPSSLPFSFLCGLVQEKRDSGLSELSI